MGTKSVVQTIFVALIIALGFTSGHVEAQGGTIVGCRKSDLGTMSVGESTLSGWTCESDGCISCRGGSCASASGNKDYGTTRCFGPVYGSTGQDNYQSGGWDSTGTPQQDWQVIPTPVQQQYPTPVPIPTQPLPPTQPPPQPQPTSVSWQLFTLVLQPGEELAADGLWLETWPNKRPIIPPNWDPCVFPVNMVSRTAGTIFHWECYGNPNYPDNWVNGEVIGGSYWYYELVQAQVAEPTPQRVAAASNNISGSGSNPPSSRSTSQSRSSNGSGNPAILIIGILLLIGSLGLLAWRFLKKGGNGEEGDPEFDEGSLPGMPAGFVPAPVSQEH